MAVLAIYLLFFLSGVSGLVYQVVWVREFGGVFGNTVHSAAIVTAVFMAGLGIGSLVVGRQSDRQHAGDPTAALRAYGWFEISIGALGLMIALALPQLEALSSAFSSYGVGKEGWFELTAGSYLVRYLSALVLLLPITLLMGGTLTLLIRYVVAGQLADAGWRIGALYGLNTAGAALGAFATDFALVPGFGIFRAELFAIALNLLVGVGALALARRDRSGVTPPRIETAPSAAATVYDGRLVATSATLFATGFVAMGFEIVWFRYLISGLGGFRATFSLLMTVILVGIFLGSMLGGYLARRTRRPAALFLAAQTTFIVVALAPMAILGSTVYGIVDPAVVLRATSSAHLGWVETLLGLPPIVAVVALAALLMGFSFPLSNAHVQRVEASLGGRAGTLYLANTLGNVVGSLATAFVLLPTLGQQASVSVLTIAVAVGLVPLYCTVRKRDSARGSSGPSGPDEWVPAPVFAGCIAVLALALAGWLALPSEHLLRKPRDVGQGARVVAISEGINETTLVVERPAGRTLYVNGHPMSANEFEAQRYMRLFSHIPLLQIEQPERVLVICFGVGTTLHAASLHSSVERLEVVDLSKNVLQQGHHFENGNKGVLHDERLAVYVNDGRQHLRMQAPASYDLITLEPPPIATAGVASLYSSEFYALSRSRLKPGGFMTQWLPAYQVSAQVTRSIIRSFIDVFPNAVLLSGAGHELILIGSTGSEAFLDPTRVRENLARDPELRRDLESVGVGSLTALVATFVAGPAVLKEATRGVAAVTDDYPVMEYSERSSYVKTRLPAEIFDAREIRSWCPKCYRGEQHIPELDELASLMDALAVLYQSDAFLDSSNYEQSAALPRSPGNSCQLETVRDNPYFMNAFDCHRASRAGARENRARRGSKRRERAAGFAR